MKASYRTLIVFLLFLLILAVSSASASATVIGTTSFPSGATAQPCTSGAFYAQFVTEPAYNYTVPANNGQITSWSTNTTGDTPGQTLSMVILRPNAMTSTTGIFSVVGFDSETIPAVLPANNIATFNIATPISVNQGDILGIYASSAAASCLYSGGAITSANEEYAGLASSPTAGATYTAIAALPGYLVNVSATFVQSQDNSIGAVATPTSIPVGGVSEYIFTVTNNGPGVSPVSFSDSVPTGLTVLSAIAASGSCSVSGQNVSCTANNLPVGSSIQIAVAVQAPTAGNYTDAAMITSVVPDPNPANNLASATLTVVAPVITPPPPLIQCKTGHLNGKTLAQVKKALVAAHCKIGKITKKTSKVRKGYVIATNPGPGKTLPANTIVRIVVSSGRHKH